MENWEYETKNEKLENIRTKRGIEGPNNKEKHGREIKKVRMQRKLRSETKGVEKYERKSGGI